MTARKWIALLWLVALAAALPVTCWAQAQRNIVPAQKEGQFCDYGTQYRSAVFFHDQEQKRVAEASRAALRKSRPFRGEIVTEITKSSQYVTR